MGASLRIEKNGRDFRDAYNAYNVWWVMGLSYSQMHGILQKKGLLDKDGDISAEGVKVVFDEVEKHPITQKKIDEAFDKNKKNLANPDKQQFHKDIMQKYTEMMEFWSQAVNLKSKVFYSV
jgi:hypothetical protein